MTVRTAVDGRVARVLIDRPEAHNALSPAVLDGLDAALDTALAARCSVLVLRGAGGSLSAGADLPHLRTLLGDRRRGRRLHHPHRRGAGPASRPPRWSRWPSSPATRWPVVARSSWPATSPSSRDEARIGDRHLEYGLLPGAGGSVRLPRALPGPLARRLLYTGEMIDGAYRGGVGPGQPPRPGRRVDAAVDELVARLARHSPAALAG